MAKQGTDQRQRRATAGQLAGKAVTQIVDSQALDASGLADAAPCPLDFHDVTGVTVAGKDVGAEFCARASTSLLCSDLRQQLPYRCRQRHDVVFFLLGAGCGLRPDAIAQIDVGPVHRQRFTTAATGQQQHPDDVSGLPVGMRGQRLGQPSPVRHRSVALAFDLAVFLDALAGLSLAHPPFDRQREHLRQHRHHGIGATAMSGLADLAVQAVDIREGDIRHLGVVAEVRTNLVAQHAAIIGGSAGTLARQMLFLETVGQIIHRRSLANSLDLGQRIATGIDHAAQALRLLAGVGAVQSG